MQRIIVKKTTRKKITTKRKREKTINFEQTENNWRWNAKPRNKLRKQKFIKALIVRVKLNTTNQITWYHVENVEAENIHLWIDQKSSMFFHSFFFLSRPSSPYLELITIIVIILLYYFIKLIMNHKNIVIIDCRFSFKQLFNILFGNCKKNVRVGNYIVNEILIEWKKLK